MIPESTLHTVESAALQTTVPLQFTGNFLTYAIAFVVLAIVAALLGAGGVAGLSMDIAKWFVTIFAVLAVITLVL